MKIIILSIALNLILSYTVKAQEKMNDTVKITIPANSKRLNREIASLLVKEKFKNSTIINKESKNIYDVGGILLFFEYGINNGKNIQTLNQIKSNLEGLITWKELSVNKNNVIDESIISSINNISYLIIKYHNGENYYYRFFSELVTSKFITGEVQFKKSDKERANKVFNDFLKNISFRK